jgi:hypothetical protein
MGHQHKNSIFPPSLSNSTQVSGVSAKIAAFDDLVLIIPDSSHIFRELPGI